MKWIKSREGSGSCDATGSSDESNNCDTSTEKINDDGVPATNKNAITASRSRTGGGKPTMEPSNVVSILVSASFLKMDPLVEVGLKYVHVNMNKILIATHNLNCLGEPLLTR